jgi:hypothetical protein
MLATHAVRRAVCFAPCPSGTLILGTGGLEVVEDCAQVGEDVPKKISGVGEPLLQGAPVGV